MGSELNCQQHSVLSSTASSIQFHLPSSKDGDRASFFFEDYGDRASIIAGM